MYPDQDSLKDCLMKAAGPERSGADSATVPFHKNLFPAHRKPTRLFCARPHACRRQSAFMATIALSVVTTAAARTIVEVRPAAGKRPHFLFNAELHGLTFLVDGCAKPVELFRSVVDVGTCGIGIA